MLRVVFVIRPRMTRRMTLRMTLRIGSYSYGHECGCGWDLIQVRVLIQAR